MYNQHVQVFFFTSPLPFFSPALCCISLCASGVGGVPKAEGQALHRARQNSANDATLEWIGPSEIVEKWASAPPPEPRCNVQCKTTQQRRCNNSGMGWAAVWRRTKTNAYPIRCRRWRHHTASTSARWHVEPCASCGHCNCWMRRIASRISAQQSVAIQFSGETCTALSLQLSAIHVGRALELNQCDWRYGWRRLHWALPHFFLVKIHSTRARNIHDDENQVPRCRTESSYWIIDLEYTSQVVIEITTNWYVSFQLQRYKLWITVGNGGWCEAESI